MGKISHINSKRPWNKGKLTGQKPPLKLKEIWAIRIRLQMSRQVRDLALKGQLESEIGIISGTSYIYL